MNALENWFKGILSGAIEGCLNTVNDMLSGALNNSDNTGLNGIFHNFSVIQQHLQVLPDQVVQAFGQLSKNYPTM